MTHIFTSKTMALALPREDGPGQFTWKEVEVRKCQKPNRGCGLFAREHLYPGLAFPHAGRQIPVSETVGGTHTWVVSPELAIDGHPSHHPWRGIGCFGLAVTMMANESSKDEPPNCQLLPEALVVSRPILPGEELLTYYGSSYDPIRRTQGYTDTRSNDDRDRDLEEWRRIRPTCDLKNKSAQLVSVTAQLQQRIRLRTTASEAKKAASTASTAANERETMAAASTMGNLALGNSTYNALYRGDPLHVSDRELKILYLLRKDSDEPMEVTITQEEAADLCRVNRRAFNRLALCEASGEQSVTTNLILQEVENMSAHLVDKVVGLRRELVEQMNEMEVKSSQHAQSVAKLKRKLKKQKQMSTKALEAAVTDGVDARIKAEKELVELAGMMKLHWYRAETGRREAERELHAHEPGWSRPGDLPPLPCYGPNNEPVEEYYMLTAMLESVEDCADAAGATMYKRRGKRDRE